jgi:LysM repeat protein
MKLSNLATVLRAAGLTVVEMPGWASRGYAGQDLADVRGVLWHHTATNRNAFVNSNAPTLTMCMNGRSDLAGPLCHIVFGRDGTVYLVAAGVANHAGRGSAYGVPTDAGNYYLIGIEMESSGIAPFDWTPDQLRVAPFLGAALERAYLDDQPEDEQLQIGHLEYSSEGKIDPAGWPGGMDGLRAAINAVLDGSVTPPAPTAPAPAPAPAPQGTNYERDPHWVVEPGETLGQVAKHYGVSVEALAAFNGIGNPDRIGVGEFIWPVDGMGTWTVDPGDTVSGITNWVRANWDATFDQGDLCYANGINDPNKLSVGVRLLIKNRA